MVKNKSLFSDCNFFKIFSATAGLLIITFFIISVPVEALASPEEPGALRQGELVSVPTGTVMNYRGRVGADYTGDRSRVFGVFNVDEFLEMGGQVEGEELGVLIKARLLQETRQIPAISAGIWGTSPYIAVSKYMGANIGLHFGIKDIDLSSSYIGMNAVLNSEIEGIAYIDEHEGRFPRTNLMLEFTASELNVGVRSLLAPELAVEAGIIDLDEFRGGLSFNF